MKRLVIWLGAFVVVLLLFLVSVPFWIDPDQFRPKLEAELTKAAGRDIKLGNLKLAILKGSVAAADLSVGDDPAFGKDPFLRAKSLNIQIELLPLIKSRQINVTGIHIDGPEITLLESPAGRWNFSTLGASTAKPPAAQPPPAPGQANAGLDLSVKLLKITNGHFTMRQLGTKARPLVLEGVDIEVRDFSSATAFPFSLAAKVAGGGDIALSGKAGPFGDASADLPPFQGNLKITRLDVAHAGMLAETPFAGFLSFDGSAQSQGHSLQASGKLKGESLRLVKDAPPAKNPVELDFAVQHDLDKLSGRVERGDIHIGKALARLTGTYVRHGDNMAVKMNFDAHQMPVQELADMLPSLGIVLPAGSSLQGGTADAVFTIEGPVEALVTDGHISFDKARLVGFNLGQKMSTIQTLAGIKSTPDMEIETLSSKVHMDPGGISTEDMKLVVPSIGQLTGGGKISAARELDYRMFAAVHTGGVIALVNDKPIPFLVSGTCSNPVFKPDMKAVAKQELNAVKDTVKGQAEKTATGLLKGLLGGKKN